MKKEIGKNKKRKNTFLKKMKGTIAVEWIICAPVSMILTFFSIFFFIFIMDYYTLGNSAYIISQRMNMGDTGYINNYYNGSSKEPYLESKKFSHNSYFIGGSPTNDKATITTQSKGENDVFLCNAKYVVHSEKDNGRLDVPYCHIESIDVSAYYNGRPVNFHSWMRDFNVNFGETESSDLVVCTIKYDFIGLIKLKTVGYSFIV